MLEMHHTSQSLWHHSSPRAASVQQKAVAACCSVGGRTKLVSADRLTFGYELTVVVGNIRTTQDRQGSAP